MSNHYERATTVEPSEVLHHIRAYWSAPSETKPLMKHVIFGGLAVKVSGLRLHTFATSPWCCDNPDCKTRPAFFAIERASKSTNPASWHLNLYGYDAKGREVLFTHDHVTARALGGQDSLDNTVTMCGPCNWRKGRREQRLLNQIRKQGDIMPLTRPTDIGRWRRHLAQQAVTRGISEEELVSMYNEGESLPLGTDPLGLSDKGWQMLRHHASHQEPRLAKKDRQVEHYKRLLSFSAAHANMPESAFLGHCEDQARIYFSSTGKRPPSDALRKTIAGALGTTLEAISYLRHLSNQAHLMGNSTPSSVTKTCRP